jgi:hypothetical protein
MVLPSIERISWQNIKKDILELNNTMAEMELTDIYKVFHHTSADHTFFSVAMEHPPK